MRHFVLRELGHAMPQLGHAMPRMNGHIQACNVEQDTGLSQQLQGMDLDASPADSLPSQETTGAAAVSTIVSVNSQDTQTTTTQQSLSNTLKDELMAAFVEEEILQHMPLVQANRATGAGVKYPTTWNEVVHILVKLGYQADAQDPWQILGLARLEGAEPTALTIDNRCRTATLLCSVGVPAVWSPEDSEKAVKFCKKFEEAAKECEGTLQDILRLRRRIKVPNLPLHKELGGTAYEMLQVRPPTSTRIATQ